MKNRAIPHFTHFFRFIGAAYLLSALLTGCASSTTKASANLINNMDVAYGRVMKIYPIEGVDSELCAKKGNENPKSAAICKNLGAYEKAKVAFLHVDTRFIEGTIAVPKQDAIKEQYILELKPALGIGNYERIASRTDTDLCHWTGPTPEFLNGGSGMAAGFLAGVLIVPGLVMLTTDVMVGGVECDGWSYKAVIEEARKK
jgi:hypothetical protein